MGDFVFGVIFTILILGLFGSGGDTVTTEMMVVSQKFCEPHGGLKELETYHKWILDLNENPNKFIVYCKDLSNVRLGDILLKTSK